MQRVVCHSAEAWLVSVCDAPVRLWARARLTTVLCEVVRAAPASPRHTPAQPLGRRAGRPIPAAGRPGGRRRRRGGEEAARQQRPCGQALPTGGRNDARSCRAGNDDKKRSSTRIEPCCHRDTFKKKLDKPRRFYKIGRYGELAARSSLSITENVLLKCFTVNAIC
jgi:hypothetical protein